MIFYMCAVLLKIAVEFVVRGTLSYYIHVLPSEMSAYLQVFLLSHRTLHLSVHRTDIFLSYVFRR